MLHARAWLAGKLVALARVVLPEDTDEPETARVDEDADEGLPMGHPFVVKSPEAERMVREGVVFSMARRARRAAPKPEAPLAGSLRDRLARARNA